MKVIKSEEAPETNDGPVTVLTANTFDEIVTLGKNVMIEFYAPWCAGVQNNRAMRISTGDNIHL